MTLTRTRAPAVEPVTLAEVKAHLRLDQASEDALITTLIKTAREIVEREAGVALIDQGFRLTLDCVPANGLIAVPVHPVTSVSAVNVFDSGGSMTPFALANLVVDGFAHPPRILFQTPPMGGRGIAAIAIDFDAGFGTTATDVPDMLKRAALLLAGHLYEFRAAMGGGDRVATRPAGYGALIAPWKRVRL
jgi:uncharacterized phiE125 gp8 family phage protein